MGHAAQILQEPSMGARILESRKAKHLTQQKVADAMRELLDRYKISYPSSNLPKSCSRAAVAQWESGVTSPPTESIELIAKVLGVSPAYLAFGIGHPEEKERALKPFSGLTLVREVRAGSSPETFTDVRTWGIPTEILKSRIEVDPEKVIITEVVGAALSPDYEPGDRVYVALDDAIPSSGPVVFWNGVGFTFAYISIIPSKDGAMVRFSGKDIDLAPMRPADAPIIGAIKGHMRLG